MARVAHHDDMYWCECSNQTICGTLQSASTNLKTAIDSWNRRDEQWHERMDAYERRLQWMEAELKSRYKKRSSDSE
jgi:uncharacterized protein YaaN involved in tellurite resistance